MVHSNNNPANQNTAGRLVPPSYMLTRALIGWLRFDADEAQRDEALAEILLSRPGSTFDTPQADE